MSQGALLCQRGEGDGLRDTGLPSYSCSCVLRLAALGHPDRGSPARVRAKWLALIGVFSLFSPLSLIAVNLPRGAAPGKLLLLGAVGFSFGIVAFGLLSQLLNADRAGAVVVVNLFAFFSWSGLSSMSVAFIRSTLVPLFPFAVLVALLLASLKYAKDPVFQTVLWVVGLAMTASPLVTIVGWYMGGDIHLETLDKLAALDAATHPDVYLVILDGYGRADVLDEMYGFDNEPFLRSLEAKGFVVPSKATSNYSMTAASLSSLLNLEYVVEPGVVPDHRLRLGLYEVIRGESRTVRLLKDLGYQYVHIESGWDGSRCGETVDECHKAGLLDEATGALLARTPLGPLIKRHFGSAFAANGLRIFERLDELAQSSVPSPRFVFAHVPLPHPPLVLDRRCSVRSEPEPGGGAVGARFLLGSDALDRRMNAYVEQTQCVNQKVLEFLDAVDDDAVVFITADHGPDSRGQVSVPPSGWTETDIRERFSVFSAYRLPVWCKGTISPDTDLINGMGILLGCIGGVRLNAVPSRHFVFPTPDGRPYPTTEVIVP